MSDVAVRAVELGKIYRIGERQAYQTIRDVIANGARSGLRRASQPVRTRAGGVASRDDQWVWVLDDVSFYAANRDNYEAYRAGLEGVGGIELIAYEEAELCSRHYVVIEVDESAALSRDELQRVLWAENVLARRYFFPGCHRMEPYRSAFAEAGRELPEAERLTDRLLALPTGTAVGPATVAVVSDLIRRAMADGRRRGDDCRQRRRWTAILRHEVGARAS